MNQFIEFAMNHPLHVGGLVALILALVITETRKGGKSISPSELTQLVNQNQGVVLDVREKADFSKGRITDAINMPYSKVKERVAELKKHQEKTIIVVDAMGQHASTVVKELTAAGFTKAVKLRGGMSTWTADSLPVVKK